MEKHGLNVEKGKECSWIKERSRSGRSGGRVGEAKGTDARVKDVGVELD